MYLKDTFANFLRFFPSFSLSLSFSLTLTVLTTAVCFCLQFLFVSVNQLRNIHGMWGFFHVLLKHKTLPILLWQERIFCSFLYLEVFKPDLGYTLYFQLLRSKTLEFRCSSDELDCTESWKTETLGPCLILIKGVGCITSHACKGHNLLALSLHLYFWHTQKKHITLRWSFRATKIRLTPKLSVPFPFKHFLYDWSLALKCDKCIWTPNFHKRDGDLLCQEPSFYCAFYESSRFRDIFRWHDRSHQPIISCVLHHPALYLLSQSS